MNLAGVAFGHDWLAGADRYEGTLEHLASWGIVAAAPDTETGVAPSVLNLAFDLGTTLDIIAGVRLGPGKISVHPDEARCRRARFRRVRGGVRRRRHARQAEGRRRGVSDGDQAARRAARGVAAGARSGAHRTRRPDVVALQRR